MERRAITVRGIVQGVGFRPFVHGLAARAKLTGFVQNRLDGVRIEIEGNQESLDRFLAELTESAPPLAHIDAIIWERMPLRRDDAFRILPSEGGGPEAIFLAPDAATCAECLTELLDPANRRYRYPFLNCTRCGPRLTIVTGAPYDRARTTMAAFVMCAACRAEYDDPADRRFHAQPTCCPQCGPRLRLVDATGKTIAGDPLATFAAQLRAGRIGAIKGLGGYHLACVAASNSTVAELRRRKARDDKPFALMVEDLAAAERLCEIDAVERDLLLSPRRPVVLLRRRKNGAIAEGGAPGNPYLGLMLPYTPLHHLLVRELEGRPLVMTSGNRSDEPIAYEDEDALVRLAGIADLFLMHDRRIHVRCDDSVTRRVGDAEAPVRRSRGYAPQAVALPFACPFPILAVGGQLKVTFALGRDRHAFLSHHLGDLDHLDAYRAFVRDIELYKKLFGFEPALVVHDLHPDYASTRYALEKTGIPAFGVQHHHAHLAACLAENGLREPVLGVTFDGTGFGTDETIWGGEFLLGDYRSFRRVAHLRAVGMPGGEPAIREPWRMALAHARDADVVPAGLAERLPQDSLRVVEAMIDRSFRCPRTSSAGRLFDAVASLAGVRDRVRFEGQAAIELEWAAASMATDGSYPIAIESVAGEDGEMLVVDTRPLVREVVNDVQRRVATAKIARRFHSTLVEMIAEVCGRLRRVTGVDAVALSGGVFLNVLLIRETEERLRREGFRVYRHRQVPPNDGGLSLGQLALAAHR